MGFFLAQCVNLLITAMKYGTEAIGEVCFGSQFHRSLALGLGSVESGP